ncbi:MAG: ComEC/Rec2 family competence protein [Candidatus Symbiothrix sp.]|nr:ComEC/Rec2 family competence protein [Candidatus Symbiothrix sp.]
MTKTLRQAVFLRLILFFIPGIIIQVYWDFMPYWVYLAVFSFPFIGVSFISRLSGSFNRRWLFGFGLSLLCVSVAGICTSSRWMQSEWKGDASVKEYNVRIIDDPVRKPKTWLCKVEVNGQKAIIYVPADSIAATLRPSDRLVIKAQFEKTDRMSLRKQGIAASAFVYRGNWRKTTHSDGQEFNIRFTSLQYRRVFLAQLRKLIPDEKSFFVAAAILFGSVTELDADTRQTFSATGSAHILSVSGLHFSIIYGMLFFIFSFLGNSRKGMMAKQLIIIPLMWLFVFLTGMGPSVIRAAIMLSLWGIGNGFLLRAFTMNTVGAAAFFMLLYNPLYLFDVGFQLSFSAVLSILLINPHLTALHESRNPLVKYIWDLSCVSTSAQLGTAPISMYYFHQFPLLYLLTNLVAIPLTGLLLFLLPFSLVLQGLLGTHAWLMFPVNKLLTFFISALENLEAVPHGLVDNIRLDLYDTICMSGLIVFLLLLLVKKRIIYLYLLFLLVALQVFYYLCPH